MAYTIPGDLHASHQDNRDKQQSVGEEQHQSNDDLGVCAAGRANLPQRPDTKYN